MHKIAFGRKIVNPWSFTVQKYWVPQKFRLSISGRFGFVLEAPNQKILTAYASKIGIILFPMNYVVQKWNLCFPPFWYEAKKEHDDTPWNMMVTYVQPHVDDTDMI